MKRPPRSFVVEVRRQRRPPGEPAPSWSEEPKRSGVKGAARDAEPPPQPAVAATTASVRPTGRILPSLIEAVPATVPAATKRPAALAKPRVQRRRPRVPAPAPVHIAEPPPVVVAPQPAAEPAAQSVDLNRAARHRRILARYVFGDALKPGERWKRRSRGDAP